MLVPDLQLFLVGVRQFDAPIDPADPPDEMDSRDREVGVAWLEGWSLLG